MGRGLFWMMFFLATLAVAPAQAQGPAIALEGPTLVFLGDEAKFSAVFSNGPAPLANVVISYRVPEGMFYLDGTPGVTLEKSLPPTALWSFPEVGAGQRVEVWARLRGSAVGRTFHAVSVSAGGKSVATAERAAQVLGVPALHIGSYDTDDPILTGETTVYVVEARNEGTSPLTNVRLIDIIPEGSEFVKADGPTNFGEVSGRLVFEAFPILQPKEKLSYKVEVKALRPGVLYNRAQLNFDQFMGEIAHEESTHIAAAAGDHPALHVNGYDTEDPVCVGKQTTYVMEVRNEGKADCTNLALVVHIPLNTRFVDAQGTDFRSEGGKVLFLPVEALKPGESRKYKVTVEALQPGSEKWQALWSCDQLPRELHIEEATSFYKSRSEK